jgi:hypothetical protein
LYFRSGRVVPNTQGGRQPNEVLQGATHGAVVTLCRAWFGGGLTALATQCLCRDRLVRAFACVVGEGGETRPVPWGWTGLARPWGLCKPSKQPAFASASRLGCDMVVQTSTPARLAASTFGGLGGGARRPGAGLWPKSGYLVPNTKRDDSPMKELGRMHRTVTLLSCVVGFRPLWRAARRRGWNGCTGGAPRGCHASRLGRRSSASCLGKDQHPSADRWRLLVPG